VWDLRLIRRELAELGLDCDAPPLPPEPPAGPPVEVRVVGAELLDPEVRTWWALAEASSRLWSAPDDVAARLHRADAARAVGWLWLAEFDYTATLGRQPEHRTARFQRGLIRLRTGRPAAALADFDDLVRRDPDDYAARTRRALALAGLGRFADAAAAFDPVAARYSEDATTMALRGLCRERAGDQTGAASDFKRVRELSANAASADNHLAWLYLTGPEPLRDAARALPLARAAVERSPEKWTYHNTLGVALYRLGRYDEAVKQLTASLEHSAADSAAWDLYVLAMCHRRLGDAARARDCFDRAVRWRRDRPLSVHEAEELDDFRAEAGRVLAGP
ncbi:MAG TPA: tetratricopeptide repeat protein, partial [Gemmataceae bacterium]